MEFRVLGPLEVFDGERPVEVVGRKRRTLLALLVLRANEVVSDDRLIEELWGERAPRDAVGALYNHVSRLRGVLGAGMLTRHGSGYVLRTPSETIDLRRFERLVSESDALPSRPRSAKLSQALAMWRGAPLADIALEPGLERRVAQLEELRLVVLERRIDADLEAGGGTDLVGELETLTAVHPLREQLVRQLLISLYRSGRQAEALEVYRKARRALADELGLEPSPALRELEKAILNQDPSLEPAPPVQQTSAGYRGNFVGREAELAELVGGLEETIAGHGRLFLLVGEPGIGKSRLTEEFASHARMRGAEVLFGRCWEAGGAPAFWPWVQSLRAHFSEVAGERLRAELGTDAHELAQILPELGELSPGVLGPLPLDSESARFRLFDATRAFLQRASARRPIAIVLDDLHAADTPSLLLLQFLARQLEASRTMLVCAFRDVDPTPSDPLTSALSELLREPGTTMLVLAGLHLRDVGRFIELTTAEPASEELVSRIHDKTDGNPFFVGEILRLLAAEGRLRDGEEELTIPKSIRSVVTRRLSHLSEQCNRLLAVASVFGREFGLDAPARVADISENEFLTALDEAIRERVVIEVPGGAGELRFVHLLIRDTLYERLTGPRRAQLHRLAVEALESLYSDDLGPHLTELAHHAIAGRDWVNGLNYARLAADRALALLAYEEAARLYRASLEALVLADRDNAGMRCELLLALGDAEIRGGNSLVAKETFLEAARIARHLSSARALARATVGYGGRTSWARAGADERLVPLLEEALSALSDEDVELRARLLARLAGALRDEHSRERRERLSREAVELARRAGNPNALAYALDGRTVAIFAPDTLGECLDLGSELCDVGTLIGDRERVLHGHLHRLIAWQMLGNAQEARFDLDAAADIADELRQPAQLWQIAVARAMHALNTGRLNEADAMMNRALELGERAQPEMAIPAFRVQQYTLAYFRGTLEESASAIEELAATWPARPALSCVLANLNAELGQTTHARRLIEQLSRDGFTTLPFDQEWLFSMSLLAETATLIDDTTSVPVLYELLTPWAGLNATDHPEGTRGSVARHLGLLATAMSAWDEAVQHFEDALAMNTSMDARPWLARTHEDYGRMLLLRGKTTQAAEQIAAAHAAYGDLAMWTHAARTETPYKPSR